MKKQILSEQFKRMQKLAGINEGLDDTSWANEKGEKITLQDLLDQTKNINAIDIKTDKLKDKVLSWKDELGNEDQEEIAKIEKSDLQYPPLIFVNDDDSIKYIVDGNHRVQKAIRNKLETIKVKLIKFSELPQNFKNVFS